MSTVGLDKTAFDGLSAANKERVRTLTSRVRLGDPVVMTVNGVDFYCWDDHRLTRLSTERAVERFPQLAGKFRGCDEDWSTAVPKEGL